jgi:hypothetical protein
MTEYTCPTWFDQEALSLARWNPRHALYGWQQGCLANGDWLDAALYERAQELQDSWHS